MRLTATRVDSPLGRWTHHEWRAPGLSAPLDGLVDALWHFEGRTALPRERTFPGGYLELIVHLGPRYRPVADGVAGAPYPLACVCGVQTAPLVIQGPPGDCRVLGIRLRPVGGYAVLGVPMAESTDRSLDLAAVVGSAADELAERCGDAPTVERCFHAAAAWLATRAARHAARGLAPHPAIRGVTAALDACRGVRSVAALRDATGVGPARLTRLFHEQVGVGPKRYARLLRFRHALERLQGGARIADAALAAGYYDQAHLHVDFAEFARLTPGAFVAATRYHASPSLAEPG